MHPKVNTQDLFFNRRPKELAKFLPELNIYEENGIGQEDVHERNRAENRIQGFFPAQDNERAIWHVIEQELTRSRNITEWRDSGSAIFTFQQDLLQPRIQGIGSEGVAQAGRGNQGAVQEKARRTA
ncbi:hypothetical protein [Geobacter sp. SVR]|uniref:hypothetical protein n=1 Tax=Geobacter sp. SVR TaxID=2495594 RepID=UPI00143F04E2|nr:hypothetical protein [Geobacter sp. SVR]GCF86771.1 hypothetical protein GSbR_33710 [Geobacter sp. SVR]